MFRSVERRAPISSEFLETPEPTYAARLLAGPIAIAGADAKTVSDQLVAMLTANVTSAACMKRESRLKV